MLINKQIGSKKISQKLFIYFVLLITGVAIFLASFIPQFREKLQQNSSEFLSGFYCGVGSGITAISILNIIKLNKILKDEKKIKEYEISQKDERIQHITREGAFITFYLVYYLVFIGSVIGSFVNMTVFYTLLLVLTVMSLAYAIIYMILNKTK